MWNREPPGNDQEKPYFGSLTVVGESSLAPIIELLYTVPSHPEYMD